MRVATFNVLHGRSPADGVVDPARLADAVRALDADVLALQEVDRDQPRSGGHDLTAVAAEAAGAVDARFAPALVGVPGRWRPATGDEPDGTPGYGVALLSRLPVRSWSVVRLPPLPVPVPLRFRRGRPQLVRDEPRVALAAVVDVGGTDVVVACTHLSFVPGWRAVQLRVLLRSLRACPRVLLLGDLNMTTSTAVRVTRLTPLASGATFPAAGPVRQIDHVLGRGVGAIGPGSAVQLPLSDHRALLAEVVLAPPELA